MGRPTADCVRDRWIERDEILEGLLDDIDPGTPEPPPSPSRVAGVEVYRTHGVTLKRVKGYTPDG